MYQLLNSRERKLASPWEQTVIPEVVMFVQMASRLE